MNAKPEIFIQPLPVVRDSDGFWFHIGVPNFDEGEGEHYKAWLVSQGLVTDYKMLESEADTHPVYVSYFDDGNANISAWEPAPPAGKGWFTISIHDTEDGPVWEWARRDPEIGVGDLQDDDAAVFDDHAVDLFARAMKSKLRVKRQQGFGGWHDISKSSGEHLAELLLAAAAKGDPVDVANFAMMLFCRHESHEALKNTFTGLPGSQVRALNTAATVIHNVTLGNQAAWIEWKHGSGAESAMVWIENGLIGPGLIPEEDEPHATNAQAYYNANQS
ncbi:hypothetical protein [Collimonas pratensis]|uniref:Uncharacterized protein n=1 Tax=Collimonas pratensis TaxID=279113 RepID=A0ABN4MCF7_9BURK|nr:hypothetical protein [Collimonas pratensis]AMP15523.1 hypothetical protein CPter291_3286 [Collimonas pratensis]